MGPTLWLGLAAVLAIAEIATLTFVLVMLAGGALAAAVVAVFTDSVALQVGAFAVTSGGLLVFVRPLAVRTRRQPPVLRSGVDALVGREVVVLERVDQRSGRVRLAGEVWSARAYHPDETLEPGARAEVVRIDGATALVLSIGPNGE